jgi:hypothetical protein
MGVIVLYLSPQAPKHQQILNTSALGIGTYCCYYFTSMSDQLLEYSRHFSNWDFVWIALLILCPLKLLPHHLLREGIILAAFAYLLAEIQTQRVEIHDMKSMVMRYGQQASYYQQFFNPPLLQKLHIGEHELGGSNGTSIEIYLKVYDWDTGDGEYSHLMDFSAKEVTDFSFYMMKRGNTGQVSWKFQSGNG